MTLTTNALCATLFLETTTKLFLPETTSPLSLGSSLPLEILSIFFLLPNLLQEISGTSLS